MQPNFRALVIDDEKLARDVVKKHLESFPEISLAGEGSNGFEGTKLINELQPDLVFLDVQMPKINGFEMLELLEVQPLIIFITAYDQFALKAFEVNAVDYLMKPFSRERFQEAMNKALQSLSEKKPQASQIKNIIAHHDSKSESLDRVVVKSGNKITVIPVDQLFHIEAQDDYVMLYSTLGNFLKQKTMTYFEKQLPPAEFLRVHRSHIVKISAIAQIELMGKESYQLTLSNNTTLPVSKSGYKKLKEIL